MPRMPHRHILLIRAVLVAAIVGSGDAASAQQVTRIPATPTCAKCDLRATRRLVLGSLDGDAAIFDQPTTVVKDSKGTFYVGEGPGGGSPLVFDSRGRFVRRLARKGRGPGELLTGITVILAAGDSVHIIDFDTGRRSIFAPSGEFVRMVVQPAFARHGLMLPNGILVVNAAGRDAASIGTPMQLIDTAGRIIRSFGGSYSVTPADDPWRPARHIGPSRSGGFWAAHHVEYEFALWSATGQLIRHYERANDFFRPNERFRFTLKPTPPRISTIWEDAAGLVWITIQVPVSQKEWEAGLGKPVTRRGRTWYPSVLRGRLFHTLIEVMDPRTGRLLVSRRFPFYAIAATDAGEYAAYRQDEDGVPYVDIWRVQMIQR